MILRQFFQPSHYLIDGLVVGRGARRNADFVFVLEPGGFYFSGGFNLVRVGHRGTKLEQVLGVGAVASADNQYQVGIPGHPEGVGLPAAYIVTKRLDAVYGLKLLSAIVPLPSRLLRSDLLTAKAPLAGDFRSNLRAGVAAG
jgi:hypothetical protein